MATTDDDRSVPSLDRGRRFPRQIIGRAVRLYHRCRDVEELLADRGVGVSYEAIPSWCCRPPLRPSPRRGLNELDDVAVRILDHRNLDAVGEFDDRDNDGHFGLLHFRHQRF